MRINSIPLDIGAIHIVGIGGIGMSGIAEVLAHWGHKVQGSDAKDGANLDRLRKAGIKVFVGHDGAHVGEAGIVLISSAVKADNLEVMAARELGIPVVRRAEMLAELMRLGWTIAIGGTHGKTTTTSMVATLLDAADKDPTVINGGIINAYGTNARVGSGDWMVVEADESDGTFTKLRPTIAIVTNMDPEHLDFYGTAEAMEAAFETFVHSVPFYGFAIMCIDHPGVQGLVAKATDRRVVTYGFNPQSDVRALNLDAGPDGSRFSVAFAAKRGAPAHQIDALHLPMPGEHNVTNALAAIAVARELGASDEQLRQGLARFEGVKRRFTKVGEWKGVRIIDDYGHHPVEIAAVLKAARQVTTGQVTTGKVVAVVQPHRFSRLQVLFDDFARCLNDADVVAITEVYSAGEAPLEGIDADALVRAARDHGHKRVSKLASPDDLADFLRATCVSGDIFVCLGAGDITAWAGALQGKLETTSPT
jgi:UDP-N-acetylmuramate--alanine ligase